ncbi:nucleotidyltransferase [Texcoconibacillus texcoconensis]|uniref:tRNA(Met) cytidine acetate ligase n=1 Tax=Texcoconibacillus texcoconensis TaxID=1095777 RepID=A0A840QLE8_9BACI|nr:nucleotidyltransferase [Texcoconibacillus texcoconensis]MBB5172192.1 putative nucleotidyltransferase [Texcoconibacillus texcoconensis]
MKAAGIIVEYNPFHYGHLHHLNETKRQSKSNVIVAVMSGPFLQRGEPALVDKWTRTKIALTQGVDIVVELPYAFATQKAETFATGAVALLNELKVNTICFGSESGDISAFEEMVERRRIHEDTFNTVVKETVALGKSYPQAIAAAWQAISQSSTPIDLTKPNNILGYHYVEAIHHLQSEMLAMTIQRRGADYHDQTIADHHFASATSIRNTLFHNEEDNLFEKLNQVMPAGSLHYINQYRELYGLWHHWDDYYPLLKYKLMTTATDQLKDIYECEEGLEHRLVQSDQSSSSFTGFIDDVNTKRYTKTRLQRLFAHIITNAGKKVMKKADPSNPPYIRLLGMSKQGQQYISTIKKQVNIPLVTNTPSFSHPLLDLDLTAQHVYRWPAFIVNSQHAPNDEHKRYPLRYDEKTGTFQ